ncbi:MAG: hypothetical protein LBS96_01865 [Oscillospiraceae bacterium]|jgi:hypothetical protein|nr:hypothetical protein [Oscillospiraceae bacterium]
MNQTKKLALSGVFTGLALALMWLISFFPAMDYALPAAAGLVAVPVTLELGRGWAWGGFFAAALLALLLLPNKAVPLLYAAFFGYYPILKSLLAQHLPRWAELLLLLAVFNAAMVGGFFLGARLFGLQPKEMDDGLGALLGRYAPLAMLAAGNLGFLAFDYAVGNFCRVYAKKWRKKLQRVLRGN